MTKEWFLPGLHGVTLWSIFSWLNFLSIFKYAPAAIWTVAVPLSRRRRYLQTTTPSASRSKPFEFLEENLCDTNSKTLWNYQKSFKDDSFFCEVKSRKSRSKQKRRKIKTTNYLSRLTPPPEFVFVKAYGINLNISNSYIGISSNVMAVLVSVVHEALLARMLLTELPFIPFYYINEFN